MKEYLVVGIMSGTSLDGVDIAYCKINEKTGKWNFEILVAETINYPPKWIKRLSLIENANAKELIETDIEYGEYLGKLCNEFLQKNNIEVELISSHGHTVFHRPEKKLSLQIGNGSAIAYVTKRTVVCNFRQLDIFLGGQGAPLVPIGDKLLFEEYDYCLNLGGFSNISFEKDGRRVAFDICPVNVALNFFSQKLSMEYDKDGDIAKSGEVSKDLVSDLNDIDYYSMDPPKSLGKEWLMEVFIPLINKYDISVQDKMKSITEHISIQVSRILEMNFKGKVLITGGGAYIKGIVDDIKNNEIQTPKILKPFATLDFDENSIKNNYNSNSDFTE